MRSKRQQELLRGARLIEQAGVLDLISKSSLDDLLWFEIVLDVQIEQTPHWVKDEVVLDQSIAWTRKLQALVKEHIFHKRRSLGFWRRYRNVVWDICLVLFGAAISWAINF